MKNLLKHMLVGTTAVSMVLLQGCGTLTGIPGHGGGKRFAVEQKLVSATIRATLKDIDVSSLKGQKVAIVFDLISDEGGGNIVGGRASLGGILSAASVVSPLTSSNSQFQVFDLQDTSSSFHNTSAGTVGSNTATTSTVTNLGMIGTAQTNGSTTGTSAADSTVTGTSSSASDTNTSTSGTSASSNTGSTSTSGTQTGTSSSNGSTTSNTSSDSSGTSSSNNNGSSTTTTGNVQTTQISDNTGTGDNTATINGTGSGTSTSSGNSSTTSNGNGTSTQTGTGTSSQTGTSTTNSSGTNSSTGTSNTNESGTSSSRTETSSDSTETGMAETNGSSTSDTNSDTTGDTTTNRQQVSNSPSATQTRTKGTRTNAQVELKYGGLGDYYNLAIPKSDASLLMGLVRNYLMLSGVQVTVPQDPEATAIVYVTVDVFGLNRSRSDFYLYNEENVIAETAIEMFAFNREGDLIMKPVTSDFEAEYKESYFFWAGPFEKTKEVRRGEGLLEDFSDLTGK